MEKLYTLYTANAPSAAALAVFSALTARRLGTIGERVELSLVTLNALYVAQATAAEIVAGERLVAACWAAYQSR